MTRIWIPAGSFDHWRSVVRTGISSTKPSERQQRSPRDKPSGRVNGRRPAATTACSSSNGTTRNCKSRKAVFADSNPVGVSAALARTSERLTLDMAASGNAGSAMSLPGSLRRNGEGHQALQSGPVVAVFSQQLGDDAGQFHAIKNAAGGAAAYPAATDHYSDSSQIETRYSHKAIDDS
jgi:hypothetical protein